MHNLHYARISAGSPEDACSYVETEIEGWGDENNWRSIIGCVDKAGKWYRTNETFRAWELPETWEGIEKEIKADMAPSQYRKDYFNKAMVSLHLGKSLDAEEWYGIRVYAQFMEDTISLSEFSLEKRSTLREYQYDEFGLTNFGDDEEHEGEIEYIVAIDMHS